MGQSYSSVNNLYEDYGASLYLVALEIAPNQLVAEKILIDTFVKIHHQQIIQANEHPPPLFITLIKLLLQTARAQLSTDQLKYDFKLKQFEHTPLLQRLICGQISLENHCQENAISRAEAAKVLRKELLSLRKMKSEKPGQKQK